jgi:hypothetical protein
MYAIFLSCGGYESDGCREDSFGRGSKEFVGRKVKFQVSMEAETIASRQKFKKGAE